MKRFILEVIPNMSELSRATLSDVATMAGVSTGTVSKYLKNPSSVKEYNRIAISNAIEALQYTPNTLAQRLARGKSNTILLYMIIEEKINVSTWLHALPLIQVFTDYLQGTGYNLQIQLGFIHSSDYYYENVREFINGKMADGIAVLSPWKLPTKLIQLFIDMNFPFVIVDNHTNVPNSNEIYTDNKKIVEDLVDYLVNHNHKRIGYIHVDNGQQHMNNRFAGYQSGMKKHKLSINNKDILIGDFSIDSGYNCVKKMLSRKDYPTAIICGNDNMAVGAMRAIQSEGLNVPNDISLVGIDNSIVSKAVEPQLTTVDLGMVDIGRIVIKNLLKRVKNQEHVTSKIIVPHRVVEGNSIKSLSVSL